MYTYTFPCTDMYHLVGPQGSEAAEGQDVVSKGGQVASSPSWGKACPRLEHLRQGYPENHRKTIGKAI